MAKYSIIDNEVGESWDCFPVQSGKGGQQRSRNKETLLAFMRFCLEEKRPFGWWTFGVTWGVEGYNAFQAALDYFLRGLPGRYAFAI